MSFLTAVRAGQNRRQQRKEARAEERAFVSVYDRQKRNKPSQVLLLLGMGASVVGASLMAVGSLVGFILVAVGVPFTVATAVWVFKHWNY